MPFAFEPLPIHGAFLVQPTTHTDARGSFRETWKHSAFVEAGLDIPFVQDNASTSKRGVLRGLHLQVAPHEQGKLVSVGYGAIFDVCVDLRRDSPTFGQWHGLELDDVRGHAFYLPPGCAHGYLVRSEVAHVHYKCTAEYAPSHDRGVRYDDPTLAIAWPHPTPTLSERDAALPSLEAFLAEQAAS